MPTTARANRTDGDAEAGAAQAKKCKKARDNLPVLSVLQTVHQHAAEAFADKTTELSNVLTPINNLVLREVNWHSNPATFQPSIPTQRCSTHAAWGGARAARSCGGVPTRPR
jgi:hypothetical protein